MTNIYEQHNKAFAQVSAHAILKDGEMVAKIAFKFPKDGAGRLYAYVHFLGLEMVRGYANGYGYDKQSAAVENAVDHVNHAKIDPENQDLPLQFIKALTNIGGNTWRIALSNAGFDVWQVV